MGKLKFGDHDISMVLGNPWNSCKLAFCMLLFYVVFPISSLSSAQLLLEPVSLEGVSPAPHKWLLKIQTGEPLPPKQRRVLEELLELPAASELKTVFELYLDRNQKLTDKDFETFSKILQTARELEELEKKKQVEVAREPSDSPLEEQQQREEELPQTNFNPERSPSTAEKEQPSRPSVDLDFLYHDVRPMRPL